jgi:type I restriction enzyme, S subunit
VTFERQVHLGDVLTLQRGFDITKAQQSDGPFPVVSSSGVNSYHSKFTCTAPGVVVGRKGTLGSVYFLMAPFWAHDTTLWVKDFKGNDPRFCYYLLRSLPLARYDVGASNPTLNRNHLHLLDVLLPEDFDAQRRVAGILSTYDDLIEVNTRRIGILEEITRRLFDEWFVGQRFPGHETASFVETEIGSLPVRWSLKSAGEIVEFDPTTTISREGAKPFVPMASLSANTMVISDIEVRSGNSGSKFRAGDTLFARITPCLENGKTGYVGFLNDGRVGFGSTEFIVMRGRSVSPEWVYLLARTELFRAHAIKSMSGATGRQRVRRESLETFPVAEPDPRTMQSFTNIVRPMFEQVYVLAQANNNLHKARDLLLPKLISGEIDLSVVGRQGELATDLAAAE